MADTAVSCVTGKPIRYVTVQPGDTLTGIAARELKTKKGAETLNAANQIAQDNKISDPNTIMPGQRIILLNETSRLLLNIDKVIKNSPVILEKAGITERMM